MENQDLSMEIVIPARDKGKAAQRYTYDEQGAVRNVTLERIGEGTEYHSSSSGATPRAARQPVWPFHHRGASEVPSTPVTSHFRKATAQTKSFFRAAEDSASLLSRTLVPDYVVNYIRGETPETLARKKEQRQWGERGIEITPQRERFMSQVVEFGDPWGSQTHLHPRDPNTDDNEEQQQGFRRFFTGWRGGLTFSILLTILILLATVICLILVASKSHILSGEATIFSGSCATASDISTGLHVVINILTIILLAGGNYFFQVLSSPTRKELAVAHSKKRWLDIGIPSLRNFLHISRFRALLAFILVLAAVASQVIFNSVLYTTQSGLDYEVAFVTEPFLNGATFSNSTQNNYGGLSRLTLLSLQEDASQSKLVNLTTDSCVQEFSGSFETSFDAVLLVVSTGTTTTTSLVQTAKSGTSLEVYSLSTSINAIALDGSLVQYCLARQGSPQTCTVNASSAMLGIVALLNLVTIFCFVVLLSRSKFEPLATLGDAIRSFLRSPDPETTGACLLAKTDVRQGRWGFKEAKYFVPTEDYWFLSPSLPRWILTVFSWILIAAPAAVALGLIMSSDPAGLLTPFGIATPYSTFVFPTTISTVQMAILASLPQILLAALYLTTNSLLTTYFLSHEFSLFAVGVHPLRVSSNPVGAQSISLYLTLPRPVSWLLLATFTAMAFVLSQAVFPAVIVLSPSSNSYPNPLVAIAFSTKALLVLLALLTVLLLVLLGLGLRRAPATTLVNGQAKGNPAVLRGGSCSAVVSARCHSAPGEFEPWRQRVTWGVVTKPVGMQEGHCAFSAHGVEAVDVGPCYA